MTASGIETDRERFTDWFHDFCRNVGVMGDDAREAHKIADCYTQPHRRYHTLPHILEMREAFLTHPLPPDAWAVEYAIIMHDAVYDPTRHDNEERSAALSVQVARKLFMPKHIIESSPELIMATKHAIIPREEAARHLVDLDLLIFAASRDRVIEYDGQIREEYAFVPEDIYRTKRAEILAQFEARPQLYLRPCFKQYDGRAKENLRFLRERLLR